MMDLNEHIKRMKELFLAEHGIVKPLISEQDPKSSTGQVTQAGTGKENPDVLFDTVYADSTAGLTDAKKKQITAKNPNFNAQLNELNKSPAYKPLMEKLDDDERAIFYYYLNQSSRLQFLQQTLEFLRSFTKKRQLEKQIAKNQNYTGEENLYNWDAELSAGDVVTTKNSVDYTKPDSTEIEIPLEVAGRTVYKDNSNEPDVTLIQAIDNWVANAKAQIDGIKIDNPDAIVQLVSIDIASSCSRLRNTGAYEGKTWNDLSKDRAEKVYELITQKLSTIGVGLDQNLQKVLRGGYNGDGSSGPDPARKFTFYNGSTTNDMSFSKTGADKLSGPDNQRQVFNYGKLLSTQLESDQYKFCLVIAKIKITAKQSWGQPLEPVKSKSQGYTLVLNPLYKQKTYKKLKHTKNAYKGKGGTSRNESLKKVPSVRSKLVTCDAFN